MDTRDPMLDNHISETIRHETVLFEEDGETAVETTAVGFDTSILQGAQDTLENSVKGFLARPIIVQEFEWNAADAPLAQKFTLNFPSTWFSRPMIREKIAGFRYFKGTLVIRLQVNAQPFNAGRLIMYFAPFSTTQSTVPTNEQHFGGITGYRKVDLDIAEVTSSTLRIPYMSPLTHIDLISGSGEMGNVNCVVYSSLTGGTSVEATVWAHFEDVSLEMPTGAPPHVYSSSRLDKFYRVNAQSSNAVAKAKKTEQEKGDFQTLFDAQTTLAQRFGDVPVIGPILQGIGWVTDAASNVAGMFGFSKPTNPDFETAVTPRYFRGFTNFNSQTLAKPLGLDARNSVVQPAGTFGTQDDEMSLAAVIQKPVYVSRFTMSTADTPGTTLFKWPVHPSSCNRHFTGSDPVITISDETYLSYLAHLFTFWRGGIEYHFKIVKTPYHSGRVRFTFVPGATMDTTLTDIDRDKCYSQIVDIREITEHKFNVPFVSNRFWERCDRDGDAFVTPSLRPPTGIIICEVLNTLRNGGASAGTIEFLVETCGAKDFQFGYFTLDNSFSPVLNIPGAPPVVSLMAQSADFFPSRELTGVTPNAFTMGEVITSLRQLLKRVTRITPAAFPASRWEFPVLDTNGRTAGVTGVNGTEDVFAYISQIYRMMSGGMRITVVPTNNTTTAIQTISLIPEYPTPTTEMFLRPNTWYPSTTFFNECFGHPVAKFVPEHEAMIDIDVPWYQPAQATLTSVGLPYDIPYNNTYPNTVPTNRGTRILLQPEQPVFISRSIAEDFSFGYLIGVPQTRWEATVTP